ncbi:Hypothetical protein SRAE_0000080700, partial [Strongyloides ratti]
SFLSRFNFKDLNVKRKRGLPFGATIELAEKIYNINQRSKLEPVTKKYKDPSDPKSYGRK